MGKKDEQIDDMVDLGDQYGSEELPEATEEAIDEMVVDPQEEESQPEPIEEQKPDDGEEAVEDIHQYDKLFQEKALGTQFKDVPDLLNRMPFYNKFTTQVSQENAQLKAERERLQHQIDTYNKNQKQSQEEEHDPDGFYQNPYPILDERYVTADKVEALERRLQAQDQKMLQDRYMRFAESKSDFAQMEPIMTQLAQQDPGYLGLRDPLAALYKEAKSIVGQSTQPIIEKAQEQLSGKRQIEKTKATTTGGGVKPKQRQVTEDDLHKLSLEDLERAFGYDPNS